MSLIRSPLHNRSTGMAYIYKTQSSAKLDEMIGKSNLLFLTTAIDGSSSNMGDLVANWQWKDMSSSLLESLVILTACCVLCGSRQIKSLPTNNTFKM
jgi:hypothetical protein